ncbi:MAG TPA: serine protease, partial [Deinococcales bacterium]|nr:serine protease [Deinococcales bacterium]
MAPTLARRLAVLAVAALSAAGSAWATPSREARLRAIHATVELIPLDAMPAGSFVLGGYALSGTLYAERNTFGSGTVVTASGLILTNAHVVSGANGQPASLVEVRVTERADQNPRPAFLAKIARFDAPHDLAALQVVANASGQPVPNLNLD